MLTNAPRGTKDILPDQIKRWVEVERVMREICTRYGYDEIRTPTFEHTELFQRGIGEGTDVVDKEMYTFTDRGNRSITLRPENTASVMRAYLQNKLYAASTLVKLFYIGSMFRYDRPQAGRLREFHQFGVEAIGEASPALDAEVIMLALELLRELGLEGLTLKLNTVGCPKCRPVYRQKLTHFFSDKLDELCGDCRTRYEKNPLRILDCKVDGGKEFMEEAPRIEDCLCDECRDHFKGVQRYLTAVGVKYELDSRLVRGLDYYTKTAFEIRCGELGAQAAIAGGGRYDGLIEELGGISTPGIGFALGIERLLIALEKQGRLPTVENVLDGFVVSMGAEEYAFELMLELRRAGLSVLTDFAHRSMKAQMKQAARSGARYALIVGEDEVSARTVSVKDLSTGDQSSVAFDDVSKVLKE